MKTTIDKEFFERWKDKKVAMWCKNKEYAKEFCRLMDENGLSWKTGKSYLSENNWDRYTTETTYCFNIGSYCDKEWYKNEGYTVLDFEDYIVKEKMTKQELVELMIENFTNEYGGLDLSDLDFTKYDCDVNVGHMKVSKNLYQDYQTVTGNLFQDNQEVGEDLFQSNQEVELSLYQEFQEVQGDLHQGYQEVQGDLHQERVENKLINNEPSHYSIAGIDTMNLILTICEHNNTNQRETFYLANTLKYLIRYKNKNGIEDLNKAKDYLNRLIEQKTMEDLPFYDVDGQEDKYGK